MTQPHPGRSVSNRRYERFALPECNLEVFKLGFIRLLDSRTNIGRRLVNISEVGVQVTVTERLNPGARVRMVAHLPKFGDRVEGELAVRWCSTTGRADGEFVIGAEFTAMPSGQMVKIQQLRKLMRSAEFKQKQLTKDREQKEQKEKDDGSGGLEIIQNPNA